MLTLEGQFVRLVPLDLGHCRALLAAADEDRRSYQFTIVPRNAIEMRMFIHLATVEAEHGTTIPFATVDAQTGRLVGSTRFMNLERWHPYFAAAPTRESPPSAVEIGNTWLADSAQRTAINTEAKLLMLHHAFDLWKAHRVTLKTDARNTRARKAITRLGAKEDAVLRAWQLGADGVPRDTAFFSILLSEWADVRANLQRALSRMGASAPAPEAAPDQG